MNDHENILPTTPNVPLLRKAVEWVEAEAAKPPQEQEWNQGDWYRTYSAWERPDGWCGTTCCVAGWVGLQSDTVKPVVADGISGEEYTGQVEYPSGLRVHVSEYAQHALGLTPLQAERLFRGGNDASDIRRIAEEIVGAAL